MESNNPQNYEIDLVFDDLNAYERAVLKDILRPLLGFSPLSDILCNELFVN